MSFSTGLKHGLFHVNNYLNTEISFLIY